MRKVKPSTYNLYFTNIRLFFKWCMVRGYTTVDPFFGQRESPAPASHLRIPLEKFPTLINSAYRPRERMMVCLGLYLMLRESEVRSIQLKHVNLSEGWIQVTIHKNRDKTIDQMPISPELDAELRTWLTFSPTPRTTRRRVVPDSAIQLAQQVHALRSRMGLPAQEGASTRHDQSSDQVHHRHHGLRQRRHRRTYAATQRRQPYSWRRSASVTTEPSVKSLLAAPQKPAHLGDIPRHGHRPKPTRQGSQGGTTVPIPAR